MHSTVGILRLQAEEDVKLPVGSARKESLNGSLPVPMPALYTSRHSGSLPSSRG